MKWLKPMLPTLVTDLPTENDWCYEVKYDGFRATIYIEKNETKIISRNLNELNPQFPEIVRYFQQHTQMQQLTPIIFDGELCVLETENKASFDKIQKRGRLKNSDKINQAKNTLPVTFLAFDLLMVKGESITNKPLQDRQKKLYELFNKLNIDSPYFKKVKTYTNASLTLQLVKNEDGEGIVAKEINSKWLAGKRSKQWLKIKNMLIGTFFILGYDESNSFFHIGCIDEDEVKMIGKVGQGFSKEEKESLISIIKKNSTGKKQSIYEVGPSICIEVEFLELSKNELRHPKFRRFRLDKHWEECTWAQIRRATHN